jgi:hypothetical protein
LVLCSLFAFSILCGWLKKCFNTTLLFLTHNNGDFSILMRFRYSCVKLTECDIFSCFFAKNFMLIFDGKHKRKTVVYRNRNPSQPPSLKECSGCACIANHNSALIYILPIQRHLFYDQIHSCLLIVAKICFVLCVCLCVSRQKTVTCLTSLTPANMSSSSTKQLNNQITPTQILSYRI